MTGKSRPPRGGDRGVSAVVGIVLLVGLVVVGSVAILILAGGITQDTQQDAENERIERGMQELDGDIDRVARGGATARRTDLDLPDTGDGAVREENTGRIWINRTNFTTGNTDVIVDERIGALRYTNGDATIGIQSSGVWKGEGNGTQMVSPPDVAYETNTTGGEPTLTVPIVVMSGSQRLEGGEVRIQEERSVAPTNNVTVFEGDLVTLTVKSRWYVGWAQYFREIAPQSGVSVDHDDQTATLRLVVPVERKEVIAGIVSGATAEDVELNNNIGLASFNSTTEDCDRCTPGSDTTLIAAGDVELNNNVDIEGEVFAGGDVEFDHPNAEVVGNASYGGDLYDDSGSSVPPGTSTTHVTGWHNDNASVIDYEPVDGVIESEAASAKANNNNSPNPHIDDATDTIPGGCTSTCELHAGTYFLESLSVNGGTLVFDTTDGPINLVVNGTVTVDGGNDVRFDVVGSDRVNIYINSETGAGIDDFAWRQGDVDIPGDRTTQLWVYMKQDADARFESGQTDFYGVVFGPGDGPNDGVSLTFDNQVWIYGALVGKFENANNNVEIVFDEALKETNTIATGAKVPKVSFLHASLNEVCIRSTSNTSATC